MHEAAIAASIIEIAETSARATGPCRIQKIGVRLGEFTAIVPEALEFAFAALKTDTLASRAVLEIEAIPLLARCPKCHWTGSPRQDFGFLCAECSAPVTVLSGREMDVVYIEVESELNQEEGASHATFTGREQDIAKQRGLRGCES